MSTSDINPAAGVVRLRSLKPLLEIVQPLKMEEETNLRHYLKSLLLKDSDTYLLPHRFYAFASAIESLAYSRSLETGEAARKIIYRIMNQTEKEAD